MVTQSLPVPPHILVVDGNMLIAHDLAETVRDIGCEVIGPFANGDAALAALGNDRPACAVIEIRSETGEMFALADALHEAKVPIVFHSGHLSKAELEALYPGTRACKKPCPPGEMITLLTAALQAPLVPTL